MLNPPWKRGKNSGFKFLVRHQSGRYYARLFLNSKEIWKTLEMSHFPPPSNIFPKKNPARVSGTGGDDLFLPL
jgi:hypothetical protein